MILPCLQENSAACPSPLFPPWDHCKQPLRPRPKSHFTPSQASHLHSAQKWRNVFRSFLPFPWRIRILSSTADVFPFSTLTCLQRANHSSTVCAGNWLSAPLLRPEPADISSERHTESPTSSVSWQRLTGERLKPRELIRNHQIIAYQPQVNV